MLASAQTVLHCAAEPIIAAAGFAGEGCGMGRQRATGSLLEDYGISIADAKAGVVEADHHE
jgi:hypothetical protein